MYVLISVGSLALGFITTYIGKNIIKNIEVTNAEKKIEERNQKVKEINVLNKIK